MFSSRYVVECQIFIEPSSEPERMIGSSGWQQTVATLCVWPSIVCTHCLVW